MPNLKRLEDDDFDERGILRDGRTMRVPMKMMDAATATIPVFSPGFITVRTTDQKVRNRNAIYDQYDAEVSQQYVGQGSHGFVGPLAGTTCTVKGGGGRFGVEGSPGTWQKVDGEFEMVCVAVGHKVTAAKQFTPRRPEVYDPAKGAIRRHGDSARYLVTMSHPTGLRDEFVVEAMNSQAAQLAGLQRHPDFALNGCRQLVDGDRPRRKKIQNRDPQGRESGTEQEVEDHASKMAELYSARDAETSSAWRNAR